LGADVRNEKIAIHGWQVDTNIHVKDLIDKYLKKGIEQVFCTDISVDGKLDGPSIALYRKLIEAFPDVFLIASGGISSINDLEELEKIGCKGAIVGKAIYEKRILLSELKKLC
jgi:phosphoribosylformimino-5-aminoimidazole carboxamide ribotide isomerase